MSIAAGLRKLFQTSLAGFHTPLRPSSEPNAL